MESGGFEGVAHGDELGLGLGELGVGLRARHQAAAGEQPQAVLGLDRAAAQRDPELAVTARVDSVTLGRNGLPPTLNVDGYGAVDMADVLEIQ